MTSFPRYFAYGRRYIAPAPYVCVNSERDHEIVYPLGVAIRVNGTMQQWMDRVQAGEMSETTHEEITAALAAWNQNRGIPYHLTD